MSRLIVDITVLAHWRGKPTGVPRVADELAARFAEHAPPIFVVWDAPRRSFRRVDYRSGNVEPSPSPSDAMTGRSVGRSAGLIRWARREKNRSPRLALSVAIPARVARRVLQPKPAPDPDRVSPSAGDVLLLCSDWHGDQPFIEYLAGLHAQGVRLAQIAYDMLPIVTPHYLSHSTDRLRDYVRAVYPICDLVLAVSQHTKCDIVTWLTGCGLAVPKVDVFRLGDDFALDAPQPPADPNFRDASDRDTHFLLCVGTVEARKNHALLYYTYKRACEQGIELPPIVIVGRRGWLSDDIYELMTNDAQTKAKFVFLHDASDNELAWLYQHCAFSVYPSLYEGWGLPIGESLARGVPCIASNTSSMPEVAGPLIPYFSPTSTDECLQAIRAMLRPGGIDEAKRRLGAYEPATWDATFQSVRSRVGKLR